MARFGRSFPAKPIILKGLVGGNNVTIGLTGVSATGAVGSVSTSNLFTIGLTGVSATGSVGSVTPSQGLTGVSSTGSVGSAGTDNLFTIGLTGVSATGSVGTVVYSGTGDISLALTGVSATGSVGTVTASGGDNLLDTHDGDAKRRKRHESQKKKEIEEDRARQEKRRSQIITAFEQVIEGKVSRETNIEQVIETAADHAVNSLEVQEKSTFDFNKWIKDLDNAQRLLDDYLEKDDEDVLVLL